MFDQSADHGIGRARARSHRAIILAGGLLAAALSGEGAAQSGPVIARTAPAPLDAGPGGADRGGGPGLSPVPGTSTPAEADDADAQDRHEPRDPHDALREEPRGIWRSRADVDDIRRDVDALPAPVARTRRRLIEAARTGDIAALRPIFQSQATPPLVAAFQPVDDAVASLKRQSGDAEGREILAILIELLEAGFVQVGPRTAPGDDRQAGGTYVWPYFAEVPLTSLSPRHYVDVYRVLTAIDVEQLLAIRAYTFFRIGIAPDGRIRYFSAGAME